ncbi:MAG: superoxide dismutase family protein [Gemmatimonadota bacterium]
MKHFRTRIAGLPAALVAAFLAAFTAACASSAVIQSESPGTPLIGLDGQRIGSVEFFEGERGVVVELTVVGLEEGLHGIHVHETGRCEAPFKSSGSHFAPGGRDHGFLSATGPHAGDLPNLFVGEDDERTEAHFFLSGVSVSALGDADGAALVIHAGTDDYRSDPAGAAGDPVACAVIAAPR